MEPWNSLYKEVLHWGQTDSLLPEQDWDLALINTFSVDEFGRLIADASIKEDAAAFLSGVFIRWQAMLLGQMTKMLSLRLMIFAQNQRPKISIWHYGE